MATSSRNNNRRYAHTSGNSLRRKNKKRKPSNNIATSIFIIIALVAVIILFTQISGKIRKNDIAEETTLVDKIEDTVTVEGINITGMNIEEARNALLSKYTWNMSAIYEDAENDNIYTIEDLLTPAIDSILTKIYSASKTSDAYHLSFDDVDDKIQKVADEMASRWNQSAKNGSISGYDSATGAYTYTDSQNGIEIKKDQLISDIKSALDAREFDKTISVEAEITKPELTKEEAKAAYKTIGTFTTKTTANKDRNNNIKLAAEAVNGTILQPGEEFSFNHTTGNRTTDRGYKEAGAYVNGKVVAEPGGGVCQVSSTLYNAVVKSGMQTTERHAHTFEPSYVTPGEDAMVSYNGKDGPDMKFINSTKSAIYIKATFADRTLTMTIIGIPILEDGMTISLKSTKTKEYDPPEPEYQEDQTLQLDEEVVLQQPTNGSMWVTNIVTKKNGEVVSDVFFHNSTYKGHAAIIERNTSGIVVTKEAGEASQEVIIVENTDITQDRAIEQGPGISQTTKATTATTAAGTTSATKSSDISKPTASSETKQIENISPTSASIPTSKASSTSLAPTTAASTTDETVPPAPGM